MQQPDSARQYCVPALGRGCTGWPVRSYRNATRRNVRWRCRATGSSCAYRPGSACVPLQTARSRGRFRQRRCRPSRNRNGRRASWDAAGALARQGPSTDRIRRQTSHRPMRRSPGWLGYQDRRQPPARPERKLRRRLLRDRPSSRLVPCGQCSPRAQRERPNRCRPARLQHEEGALPRQNRPSCSGRAAGVHEGRDHTHRDFWSAFVARALSRHVVHWVRPQRPPLLLAGPQAKKCRRQILLRAQPKVDGPFRLPPGGQSDGYAVDPDAQRLQPRTGHPPRVRSCAGPQASRGR